MILAEVVFSTEGLAIITVLLSAVTGALVVIWKLLLAAHTREIARLDAEIISYRQISKEALDGLESMVDRKRVRIGLPPAKRVADVVPESASPPTPEQVMTSEIATARARVVAAKLELLESEDRAPEAPRLTVDIASLPEGATMPEGTAETPLSLTPEKM